MDHSSSEGDALKRKRQTETEGAEDHISFPPTDDTVPAVKRCKPSSIPTSQPGHATGQSTQEEERAVLQTPVTAETSAQPADFIKSKSKKKAKKEKPPKVPHVRHKPHAQVKIRCLQSVMLPAIGFPQAFGSQALELLHGDRIKHLRVVHINGLDPTVLSAYENALKPALAGFGHGISIELPGKRDHVIDPLYAAFNVRFPEKKVKKLSAHLEGENKKQLTPIDLMMSFSVMQTHNYPLPTINSDGGMDLPNGYWMLDGASKLFRKAAQSTLAAGSSSGQADQDEQVAKTFSGPEAGATSNGASAVAERGSIASSQQEVQQEGSEETQSDSTCTSPPTMMAVDCEMCMTAAGPQLSRISVVDEQLKCVYDTLVTPEKPITDYLTKYSGITEQMLAPVTTTLADVRKRLSEILTPDTILVGHSLENDLRALKMCHPRVIDTAIAFKNNRGPDFKSSLRHLSQKHLKQTIQDGTKGHCSIEDARTCMELVKLKLEDDPKAADKTHNHHIMRILTRMRKHACVVASASTCRHYTENGAHCLVLQGHYSGAEGVSKLLKASSVSSSAMTLVQLDSLRSVTQTSWKDRFSTFEAQVVAKHPKKQQEKEEAGAQAENASQAPSAPSKNEIDIDVDSDDDESGKEAPTNSDAKETSDSTAAAAKQDTSHDGASDTSRSSSDSSDEEEEEPKLSFPFGVAQHLMEPAALEKQLKDVSSQLQAALTNLPSNSLVMLLATPYDHSIRELNRARRFQTMPWTDEFQKELHRRVSAARMGTVFFKSHV